MAFDIQIGDLRWPVVLCDRLQSPDPDSTGLIDDFSNPRLVHADIRPVGTTVYLDGVGLEFSISHRITIRNDPNLGLFSFIFRDVILPNGSVRRETFQVRRIAPVEGRHRFLLIEAQILDSGAP